MAKVQNKFGTEFSYNTNLGETYGTLGTETSKLTLGPKALTSKNAAYMTARHELKHFSDLPLIRAGMPKNQLEIRAFKHELLSIRASSIDYRNIQYTMRINHMHRGFGVFTFNPFMSFNSIF
jgi:hypothetical protein